MKKRISKFNKQATEQFKNLKNYLLNCYDANKDKKITARNAAKNCDLTIDTFYRMVKK